MRVADLFARAAALVSGSAPSTRAAVEASLRDVEARAKAAAGELETLAPRRAELLVSGSDAEVAKHDAAVSKLSLERDRAAAIAARLAERLAVIVAEEAAAEKARRRSEVEMECELARDALGTRYPKLVAEARALLRTLAKAQSSREDFAKAYPGEAPIADPEMTVRAPSAMPDVVMSERQQWGWAYMNGKAVPINTEVRLRPQLSAEEQADLEERRAAYSRKHCTLLGFPGSPSTKISDHMLSEVAAGRGGHLKFETCYGDEVKYVVMTRRELRRPYKPRHPDRLADTLRLPPLVEGDQHPGWDQASRWPRSAAEVLRDLDTEPAKLSGERIVEYVPIAAAPAA